MPADLLVVEDVLPVLAERTGLSIYDFDFRSFLPCRHPYGVELTEGVVARVGAFDDYEAQFEALRAEGIALVHAPDVHMRASYLPKWYPEIEDLTPKSVWFDAVPSTRTVESTLSWPVFVKGARQTSRHQRSLSIARTAGEFERVMALWAADPILRWQPVVCRQFVELRPVADPDPERIPSSFEFRMFFWHGSLVGSGRYWWEGLAYDWTEHERQEAERVARVAARRVNVPFLVVDVAQTQSGRWLVIECNDAQESGYAGVSPFSLWQNIVAIERDRHAELGHGALVRDR